MTKYSNTSDPMACPRCGSHYTQALSSAFLYSARIFHRDRNADAIPKLLEPPERKSELLTPAFVGGIVTMCTYVISFIANHEVGLGWTPTLEFPDVHALGLAVTTGLIVAIAATWRAIAWNNSEFLQRFKEWHEMAVCRRCGAQFSTLDLVDKP